MKRFWYAVETPAVTANMFVFADNEEEANRLALDEVHNNPRFLPLRTQLEKENRDLTSFVAAMCYDENEVEKGVDSVEFFSSTPDRKPFPA